MKIYLISLPLFLLTSVAAQQPPRLQAINECSQAKQLSLQIAEIKNLSATRADISTVKSMSSDGGGVMGDLALVFFNMHKKGDSPDKFSVRMYQRCMRSNGY